MPELQSWYDYYGGRSVSTAGVREATRMAQLALSNHAYAYQPYSRVYYRLLVADK